MVQNPFAYRRPNHSIQSRAVSAPRQHSNPHHSLLEFLNSGKSYARASHSSPATLAFASATSPLLSGSLARKPNTVIWTEAKRRNRRIRFNDAG
jgi:hypothetical protein